MYAFYANFNRTLTQRFRSLSFTSRSLERPCHRWQRSLQSLQIACVVQPLSPCNVWFVSYKFALQSLTCKQRSFIYQTFHCRLFYHHTNRYRSTEQNQQNFDDVFRSSNTLAGYWRKSKFPIMTFIDSRQYILMLGVTFLLDNPL